MRNIVILHENEEWLVPLRQAFAERGVEPTEMFLDEGAVPFTEQPEDAVYYNRMSASSHTRGHRFAPELTRMVLTWLERHQRTVLNDTRALRLEVCKLSQYAALELAGLKVPKTHAVVGREQIVAAAKHFAHWPFILKPNRGGKGLGVIKFEQLEQLQNFVDSSDYEEPLDGTWLLQEYIKPAHNHITRSEFVGQKFIYAVNVNTDQGFELCPADVCSIDDAFCPTTTAPVNKFKITEHYNQHPIIGQLEGFLKAAGIDVAGIEFIENEQGELFVYDVNTNTNYNQQAEREAGLQVTGMGAIADYLIGIAKN